ncbi:hypothetical protein B7994_04985 [Fibrobacter sp. UWR2]|nr:hypothetical protein B7994_04985 [Fibrobacter sp. UWR2]
MQFIRKFKYSQFANDCQIHLQMIYIIRKAQNVFSFFGNPQFFVISQHLPLLQGFRQFFVFGMHFAYGITKNFKLGDCHEQRIQA